MMSRSSDNTSSMTTGKRRAEQMENEDYALSSSDTPSNVSLSSDDDDDDGDDDDDDDDDDGNNNSNNNNNVDRLHNVSSSSMSTTNMTMTSTSTTTTTTTPQGRKTRRRVVTPSSSSTSSFSLEVDDSPRPLREKSASLVSPFNDDGDDDDDDDDEDKVATSKPLRKRSRKRYFPSKAGRRGRPLIPRKKLSFSGNELEGTAEEEDQDKKEEEEEDKEKMEEVVISPAVREVYSIVTRTTGSLGGNGHGGAIYGELTMGSMAKMVHLMKTHCGLDQSSRFIDVGCGLGKPNFFVAQDPQVAFSFGIEMEHVRWALGVSNWHQILKRTTTNSTNEGYKCVLQHGNIVQAKTFDPFTHVYMFDIGFPPALFETLCRMFQRSSAAEYLICFHGPRIMMTKYNFPVKLLAQTPTRMHGSLEVHTGYVYQRVRAPTRRREPPQGDVPCDALFQEAWTMVQTCPSVSNMARQVQQILHEDCFGDSATTRQGRRRRQTATTT